MVARHTSIPRTAFALAAVVFAACAETPNPDETGPDAPPEIRPELAKEIRQRVGELGRHIHTYEQLMQKLGGSLGTTVNHFNNAHKELRKVDKDVVKIADTSPAVEPLLLDKPTLDSE